MTNKVNLPKNALEVLVERYSLRDEHGQPVEAPEEIFARTARVVAEAENRYRDGIKPEQVRQQFEQRLFELRFIPNGRTLANAGAGSGQLANCFVLPVDDDLGKSENSIFLTLRNAVLILQSGGGVGFSFGRIRHKGAPVSSSKGKATGAVSFLKIYDTAFWVIGQGGGRRSACMGVLPVHHPDILDFIHSKETEGEIEHFNISVGITDEFMKAVKADKNFGLINPHTQEIVKKVRAKSLFSEIVKFAHHNGEPGVLFLDTANRENPVPNQYNLEATNPCFVGSTRIATGFGLLRIDELARMKLPLELTIDKRTISKRKLGVVNVSATHAYLTGNKKNIYEITTKKGYQIATTLNHRFFTDDGYKEVGKLNAGDELYLQSGEGVWSQEFLLPTAPLFQFQNRTISSSSKAVMTRLIKRYQHIPERWSQELGLVLGWLVGDGWLTFRSNSPLGLSFGRNEDGIEGLEKIVKLMTKWFTKGYLVERQRSWQITFGKTPAEFFRLLGLKDKKATEKTVPESIYSAPREAVVGFLQGLFSADGTVQISEEKQYCSVRLASSSVKLLRAVQLLLLNFGIVSSLHLRRKANRKLMPNSKGSLSEYHTAKQYELIIGKQSRNIFFEKIGFFTSKKQAKLATFLSRQKRGAYKETYTDEIKSIKYIGEQDVYDITEPTTHSLIGNGFVTHNCGEQFLGPFENCCMASINLREHVISGKDLFQARIDWPKLAETVGTTVRFLDDVIDANKYVPAVPQLQEAAFRNRRIGVSIMGLADMMYLLGIPYGTRDGEDLAGQVMEFIQYRVMLASHKLAQERGPFPGIRGSRFDPANMQFKAKSPLVKPALKLSRPKLDWQKLYQLIKKDGIRNSSQTTIAPTGAIATISGLEGYGCEPVFALSYVMHTHEGADYSIGNHYRELYYESRLFEQALMKAGLTKDQREKIFTKVRETGTCQGIDEVPEKIRRVFVVSGDLTAKQHVRMQAALQRFIDNSISKTINFPAAATLEDVQEAYFQAWELGCKGMTVYVTGSRKQVVLETKKEEKPVEFATNGNGFRGKPLIKLAPGDAVCPECGAQMIISEGCMTCPNCAYSRCDV